MRTYSPRSALDAEPYRWIKDENGIIQRTFGALLPKGYRKHDDPEYSYICPIRSCRSTLPTMIGLGKHFNNMHRGDCLNDNQDGTFTIVGTYANKTTDGRLSGGVSIPVIVVSKGPKSLEDSPLAAPTLNSKRLKAGVKSSRKKREITQAPDPQPRISRNSVPAMVNSDRQDDGQSAALLSTKARGVHPDSGINTGIGNDTSRRPSTGHAQTTARDPEGSWEHICSRLKRNIPIPDVDGAAFDHLLQLPRLRQLELDRQIDTHLDHRQLMSMLVYIVGVERPHKCTNCRSDGAPFERCVTIAKSHATALYREKGVSRWVSHSCARCLLRENKGNSCSLECAPAKDGVAVWDSMKKSPATRPRDEDVVVIDTSSPEPESRPTTRGRSSGAPPKRYYDDIMYLNAEEDSDADDDTSQPWKRRATGGKTVPGYGPQRRDRETVIAYADGVSPFETEEETDEDESMADASDEESSDDEFEDQEPREMIIKLKIPDSIMAEAAKIWRGESRSRDESLQPAEDGNNMPTSREQPAGTEDGSTSARRSSSNLDNVPLAKRRSSLEPLGTNITPGILPREMEDWECNRAAGNSLRGPAGNVIASQPNPGEIIYFTNDLSLVSKVLASGDMLQFTPHRAETRIVTVISGGVRVKLDGSEAFAIGPGGFFKIEVGVGCAVENHFYVAAAVHVITIVAT
ncbi:hypothetical protein B0T14DRAFT_568477 [Immersiella caudata]|uniref:C2H2-type domain-containing protein n=1 Tax=Immersiella caudata TaxID=314043 RepID=A0AA40BX74_9PEZI|nr:hypothetical protein B0T14DRAFT_568477 [Immersiella caudata]